MKNELIEVALLGKSVGLKGYVKLHNKSDFPEQFKKDAVFFDANENELIVKHFDYKNSTILFAGFENIELAKRLTNKTIYTTKELTRKSCKLKKDEYFYFDIIGLNIIENGEFLGIVVDIEDGTRDHLLQIQTNKSLVDNGFVSKFYIPYIDRFVTRVDLPLKQILVKDAKAILENS